MEKQPDSFTTIYYLGVLGVILSPYPLFPLLPEGGGGGLSLKVNTNFFFQDSIEIFQTKYFHIPTHYWGIEVGEGGVERIQNLLSLDYLFISRPQEHFSTLSHEQARGGGQVGGGGFLSFYC